VRKGEGKEKNNVKVRNCVITALEQYSVSFAIHSVLSDDENVNQTNIKQNLGAFSRPF